MISVSKLEVITTSLVSREEKQKIVLRYECSGTAHLFLSVFNGSLAVAENVPVAFSGGVGEADVMLPVQAESFEAVWHLSDKNGWLLAEVRSLWQRPREWTIYVMISSHTDIGLHNSQYIQRKNSSRFLDCAAALCDATREEDPLNRYRYTAEGTWFWNNYGQDRGVEAAKRFVEDYVKTGQIGICAGVAGNHMQTFGLEEMCRCAYERRRLMETWGVESETFSMIDNNGIPWSVVEPFCDAGYRNLIFAPNHWNPIRSTVWKPDLSKPRYVWNTASGGGGSRMDVRPESHLPMVFDWEGVGGRRLTVWCCSHYADGFGFFSAPSRRPFPTKDRELILRESEEKMWQTLALLEKKFPFDIWLTSSYWDDQEPDTYVLDQIRGWNAKWRYPRVRTLGNPDEPFRLLRERFGDRIPVLRGDITGGWYQHPLSVPEIMSQKFEADRALPNAEKWATVAAMIRKDFEYPATAFRRAWDQLLFNDEHSYGTSGYKGRSVYETWMQHRDWIETAAATARSEEERALGAIASCVAAKEETLLFFNPTGACREEEAWDEKGDACHLVSLPPLGYRAVPVREMKREREKREPCTRPPTVENAFYRIRFGENGAISSLYDKELGRELLEEDGSSLANRLLYTKDNHQSFCSPAAARFEICRKGGRITVTAQSDFPELGGVVTQSVTLLSHEKRIDLENRISPARDLAGNKRYDRYLYYAFPFRVDACRRYCHLNGAVAEYAKDVTGHGTDVYMASCEWCCAENEDFGVALMMQDTHVTEFDRIHGDKTDFGDAGEGSAIYSYAANDWLQMHTPGGSHLHFVFRYAITSYQGGYRKARVPQMAERYLNPVKTVRICAQEGTLPADCHRFLPYKGDLRLLCLKRADDGNGIIARLYGEGEAQFDPALCAQRNTVDERPSEGNGGAGFLTYRLGKERIRLRERREEPPAFSGAPLPVGSVYTGLISKPRAASGEEKGQLYLLWGASREENFSHYKLYRSERAGFVPDDESFLCHVLDEDYAVGRYVDTGLKEHTPYYYRVCAVDRDGVCGPMSEEFSAYTGEFVKGKEKK